MEPLKTGFMEPTVEFFNPRRNRKEYWIRGVEYEEDGTYIINGNARTRLPQGTITGVYTNDLGGLSLQFSASVVYYGNLAGNVALQTQPDSSPMGFDYATVARVKKADEIVWENRDVPRKRKLLAV